MTNAELELAATQADRDRADQCLQEWRETKRGGIAGDSGRIDGLRDVLLRHFAAHRMDAESGGER